MPPTISSNVLQYHCLGLRHYTTTTTALFAVGVENSRPQTVRRITPGGHEANDELGLLKFCEVVSSLLILLIVIPHSNPLLTI